MYGKGDLLYYVLLYYCYYIVACQRGGVSNKPPGLRAATTHGLGILWFVHRWTIIQDRTIPLPHRLYPLSLLHPTSLTGRHGSNRLGTMCLCVPALPAKQTDKWT